MNNKIKIIISCLISASIALGLIYFVIIPLWIKNSNLSQQIEQQRALGKNKSHQQEYEKIMNKIKSDYQAIAPKIKQISNALLSKDQAVVFIESLENLAASLNLEQDIVISDQTKKDKQLTQFKVNLQGDFPQIVRYSEAVENLPYINKIDQIYIYASETKKNDQIIKKLNANLAINVIIY